MAGRVEAPKNAPTCTVHAEHVPLMRYMRRNGVSPPEHHCGAGGGPLLCLREIGPAQRHPSTNADVWRAAGCANALYTEDSPICAACWMAYLAPIDKWCRSLDNPAHFRVPLAPVIRDFPIPQQELSATTIVYNQLYGESLYTESVGYWYERDDACTDDLRQYAEAHGLALDLEPGPPERRDQILVSATYTRRA